MTQKILSLILVIAGHLLFSGVTDFLRGPGRSRASLFLILKVRKAFGTHLTLEPASQFETA